MGGLDIALLIALVLGPFALLAPLWERDAKTRRVRVFTPGVIATCSGVCAFGLSFLVRSLGTRELGIIEPGSGPVDIVAVTFALLVVAPLDETLRVLSVALPLRSRHLKRPFDGMRLAIGAAVGFASAEALRRLWGQPVSWLDGVRVVLDTIIHVSLTGLWGFAIARQRRREIGGPGFGRTFLAAVLFGGVATHLLLGRGTVALWAAVPLVVSGALTALVARRDLLRISEAPTRRRLPRLLSMNAPSIEQLERALLRKPERPVMLRWIVFGAFVTVGVLMAMLAASILLGHRTGVDFAAVDEAAAFEQSAPPLVLLGSGTLSAFPLSGYLVARASLARSVLEPALAASVAIVGLVVLLGLAAPIAVVFGLAVAPVAFFLACLGAWVGLER